MLRPSVAVVVGLTGGIGAGKSTFAGLLRERGAEVIDVDAIGREVIAPGSLGAAEVIDRFGTLDRGRLAGIVFADESARRDLEAISWPLIEAELRRRVAATTADVVVLDMAVLAQGLGRGIYDTVVTVEAPVEVRLERLVERGMPREDAEARMAAQVPESTRRELASVVVENAGTIDDLAKEAEQLLTRMPPASTP